jgi:hypothetical protein
MSGIEIHGDLNSKFLTVTLADVLPCLHPPQGVQWHLWNLEAWSSQDWAIEGLASEAYEQAVLDSPSGLPTTLLLIQQLAQAPAQIVNLLLGSLDIVNLRDYSHGEKAQLYAACEYVIEVFDSSYLIVHSKDEAFLTCLRNRLDGVKTVVY